MSLFVMACATSSMANESSYCGKSGAETWDEIAESLVGHWTITHQSGYALAGGMVIPFPGDPELEVLTIAQIGDVLEASHPEMQAPMVLRLADEPRWAMETDDPSLPKPTLTLSDLELVVGCEQMELPRIIGTTTAVVDGIKMDFVNRLILINPRTLYGVMEMNTVARGTPVRAVRTVSLTRDVAQ
ncbi:hypothetical protein [Tabrizicola sp.]|uniref:hypothetical protein n=1 Tax=Tabrizicola sp. TaxID=2005166 RepID=UPI002605642B|nr:hypothetical protein [Tabrizicola sp.]MDM7931521.1 hypothetical protein [Tabrizicola sp.]